MINVSQVQCVLDFGLWVGAPKVFYHTSGYKKKKKN